jgi:hypothetical protein
MAMKTLFSRLNIDPYIASILGVVALASALPAHGLGMTLASDAGTGADARRYRDHRRRVPEQHHHPRRRLGDMA